MNAIIKKAMDKGQKALSEFDSKRVIKSAGVPITKEALATTKKEAIAIAKKIGYPVVFHKTEMGMVKVGISSDKEAGKAYDELVKKKLKIDGILVQEMIKGNREFVIGLTRDPQFGPCVMFGLGGIFTEALKDVSFRVAPITEADAEEMIDEIKTKALLEAFRGSPPVDRSILVKSLVGIGKLGFENDEIAEIDINPLIISGKKPVAVDALVILKNPIK
jgi:acyl-CoA synthetase (NDP forming)